MEKMTPEAKKRVLDLAMIASTEMERRQLSVGEALDRIVREIKSQSRTLRHAMGMFAMSISWLPAYVAARDRYHSIPRLFRWLFPRLRRRYERLKLEQRYAVLNAAIEFGKERVAKPKKHIFHIGACCRRADCGCSKHGGRGGTDLPEPPLHDACDCYLVPCFETSNA